MKLAAALLLALAAPLAAAPSDHPLPIGEGRVLNLWCDGRKGRVVLFDSGWAADSRAWKRVMAGLSRNFRVCAQDRAGSGRSSPGPMPRDGEAIARDLKAALEKGSIPGPYILVGHSLGGLHMRHFARLFPGDVAGLVLVDPTTPTGPGAFQGQAMRARACIEVLKTDAVPPDKPHLERCRSGTVPLWEARLSEIESIGGSTSSGLADQGPGSLSVPLIVLRPAVANPGAAQPVESLAALSALGEARQVTRSGHMMMFDRPDAVIAAVESVRDRLRADAAPETPESGGIRQYK